MTAQSDRLVGQVIQKLGYLIDLTRIIDRNTDDGTFENQGGTIHYVFDTNVTQMFFEPFRNPHFAEVFFGPLWGDQPLQDNEINSQNCLIAAEYLFSGRLPGQSNSRWYMSELHRQELDTQIEYLQEEIQLTEQTLQDNPRFKLDTLKRLQMLNSALSFDELDKSHVLALMARSGASQHQMDDVDLLTEPQFKKRAIELKSREVCRVLALDRVLEPKWQLDRFHEEPEMLSARGNLEDLLQVGERSVEIFREARGWHKSLASVLARRGSGVRSEAAIRADCETLALISWGNREVLPRDERLVFVTGDRALLEAYKQRYVDEPSSGPFLLRPINHFSPLFNPSSAGSMLASKQFAFQALREALEGAMLALNLGLFNIDQPSGKLRARDHFASKVEREIHSAIEQLTAFFPMFKNRPWLLDQDKQLKAIVARLRPIERLMLEAYPRLVAARLNDQQDQFISTVESARSAVNAHIVEQLKQAKRVGFRFSLPLMNETVGELLDRIKRRKSNFRTRALISLKLSFSSDPGEFVPYAEVTDRLQAASEAERENLLAELLKTPQRIFALAAVLAFDLERWNDATRYAALAASASSEVSLIQSNGHDADDHRELLYLSAVSLRFRMSAWEPTLRGGYREPLSQWRNTAKRGLDQCAEYHRNHGQMARLLRVLSERASLQVSYCEWLTFGPETLARLYDRPELDALEALAAVVDDLNQCDRVVDLATERSGGDPAGRGSPSIVKSATLQFRLNVLGARLAGDAMAKRWVTLSPRIAEILSDLPAPTAIVWEGMPHLAEAYIAASRGDLVQLMAISSQEATLPLDRTIIRGLQRLLGRPTPH